MPRGTMAGPDVCVVTVINAFGNIGREFLKQGGQAQQGREDISDHWILLELLSLHHVL